MVSGGIEAPQTPEELGAIGATPSSEFLEPEQLEAADTLAVTGRHRAQRRLSYEVRPSQAPHGLARARTHTLAPHELMLRKTDRPRPRRQRQHVSDCGKHAGSHSSVGYSSAAGGPLANPKAGAQW